jgi:hypothetical protein
MTRTKCAHPGCRCDVEAAFGRFCSEACYDATRTAAEEREERCRCGHPGCSA